MKSYKLAYNTIGESEYKSMISFLKQRKYLNQSKITDKFQKNFSKFLKINHSIFVNSGSSANLLIAQTLLEGKFIKNKTVVLPCSIMVYYSKPIYPTWIQNNFM